MNVMMDHTATILMISCLMSCTGFLEAHTGWGHFWHKLRYGESFNLRSSCPWTYEPYTYSNGCTSYSAVLHRYAQHSSCIDLDRSTHTRDVYSQGRCQPIPSTCGPCGKDMVIGYTCVYPLSADRKRNIDEEFMDAIQSIKAVIGGYIAEFVNGTVRYLEKEEIDIVQLYLTNGTYVNENGNNQINMNVTNAIKMAVNEASVNKSQTTSKVNNGNETVNGNETSAGNIDKETTNINFKNGGKTTNSTGVGETNTHEEGDNKHPIVSVRQTYTPSIRLLTQSGQNPGLVPPFLNGHFNGNNMQLRSPPFLRGLNAQLGLPPLLRPGEMQGFNGENRQGAVNVHEPTDGRAENTPEDNEPT